MSDLLTGNFFAPWIRERCSWIGPMGERTTAAFVASSVNNGLEAVHFTWAGTFVLEAAVFLYPNLNFILADADCVPLALFEVGELRQLATHLMQETRKPSQLGAVLLVSEPHAEINAGWVCIWQKGSVGIRLLRSTDSGSGPGQVQVGFSQNGGEINQFYYGGYVRATRHAWRSGILARHQNASGLSGLVPCMGAPRTMGQLCCLAGRHSESSVSPLPSRQSASDKRPCSTPKRVIGACVGAPRTMGQLCCLPIAVETDKERGLCVEQTWAIRRALNLTCRPESPPCLAGLGRRSSKGHCLL